MKHRDQSGPSLLRICAAALLLFVFVPAGLFLSCVSGKQARAASSDDLPAAPAKFLTDVCVTDAGDLWITAEAGGVYRLRTGETEWEDMRACPGFPDTEHCTAVCEDAAGRIWVGTPNLGVAVFNGKEWRRYDRDTVLSGSHVFDLAATETGLTAVAHEQGVSMYDAADDSWRDFSVLNGLPAGPVRGVCFGDGDVLNCASESGGFAQIDVRGSGRIIRTLTAPDAWGEKRAASYPLTRTGAGLSSNFCNGISVGANRQICIAGLNGISYGADGGFRFLQGKDLKAKMDGAARKDLIPDEAKVFGTFDSPLKESYVSCVQYGRNGLWIGYRVRGFELRDPLDPQVVRDIPNAPEIDRPVRAFAELPDGRVYCATYGAGLVKLCCGGESGTPKSAARRTAAHPSAARRDPGSVLRELRRYDAASDTQPAVWAHYLGEDWCTRGDWCGHYGARRQILCGMNVPSSLRPWDGGISNSPGLSIHPTIGPHRTEGDSRRLWIDWEKANENRNVLYQMEYAHRTQSEWNDNGEEYPRTFEGPDLWLTLRMDPEAVWRLSLYFFNSNSRVGDNHERDYIVEIYRASDITGDLNECVAQTPLCTARVGDFGGVGVYKSFVLHGSTTYRVRLVRNGSLNVILNGIFLDHLFEAQDVREIPAEQRIAEQGSFRAPRWYQCGTDRLEGTAGDYLRQYFASAETAQGISAMPLLRLAFYRFVRDNLPDNRNLAERLRWDAAIWTDADRTAFDAAMKEYWAELQEKYPNRRSAVTCPYSPGVTPLKEEELKLMDKLGIDWKPYRIDSKEEPELSIEDLRRKLAGAEPLDPEDPASITPASKKPESIILERLP